MNDLPTKPWTCDMPDIFLMFLAFLPYLQRGNNAWIYASTIYIRKEIHENFACGLVDFGRDFLQKISNIIGLTEYLILPKIDFNDHIYSPLTDAQVKKLQRLQSAAESFVSGKCVFTRGILKLNWFPLVERRALNCMKRTYKAIHYENQSTTNQIEIKTMWRMLHGSNGFKLMFLMVQGTF